LVGAAASGCFLWFQRGVGFGSLSTCRPDSKLLRETIGSTGKVFAGSILGYLNGRLDNIVVAAVLGPAAMSFYGIAWNASRLPILLIEHVFAVVAVPVLAHIQGDDDRVTSAVSESLTHSYLILLPISAIMFVSAPSLVVVVLGATWLPVVPCLRIMSVAILFGPIISVGNAILIATGRGQLPGLATVIYSLALIPLFVPLTNRWGITGAAFAVLLLAGLLTIVIVLICRKVVPQVKWNFTSNLFPAAAAVGGGLAARSVPAQLDYGITRAAVEAVVAVFTYMMAVWLLDRSG